MKTNCSSLIIKALALFFITTFISSCDKEVDIKLLSVLTTTDVIKMTEATAYSGGNITSDAGFDVTSRGVCWSESPNPTIEDKKTIDAAGTGVFESIIVGLNPSTTYYVRAYAVNKKGVSYGNQVTIKTKTLNIITNPIIAATNKFAVCGGSLESDGDSISVIERGICWSTSTNPTITNNKIANGKGLGQFSCTIPGLQISTQYFVRAYATNAVSTYYGNEVSFSPLEASGTVKDIDGNIYNYITIGTQTWMVENLKTTKYNDGTNIPAVTSNTAWAALTTGAYCWYGNSIANKAKYGALYNRHALKTEKVAPVGWRVATSDDWVKLISYVSNNLGNSGTVGKALAANTNWASSSTVGDVGNNLSKNNSTGFTALPGGFRESSGEFRNLGLEGNWWEGNFYNTSRDLTYNRSYTWGMYNIYSNVGYSVRCVRD